MHLVIAGLNAWSVLFLSAATAGAFLGWQRHPTLGLLAVILALMAQSAVFALFIGAAKSLKEVVAVHGLSRSFVDRTNKIYFKLFPWPISVAFTTVTAAVLGGLAGDSSTFRWIHASLALAAYALNVAAAVPEYRQFLNMHLLLRELDLAVPPRARNAGLEAAGPEPADPRARGKAILTLGALALVTVLGYHYLARVGLSNLALAGLTLPIAAWMGLGAYQMARGRRDAGGD